MKRNEILKKDESLSQRISDVDKKALEIESRLESIAKLSTSEAKELLMKYTEERYEKDILGLMEKKRKELKSREQEITKEVLIKSIQQYA